MFDGERGRAQLVERPEQRIGRDTRASGPGLVSLLAEGLTAFGLAVVDGGVLTTPAVQTLCREEKYDSAIVVSASEPGGLTRFRF